MTTSHVKLDSEAMNKAIDGYFRDFVEKVMPWLQDASHKEMSSTNALHHAEWSFCGGMLLGVRAATSIYTATKGNKKAFLHASSEMERALLQYGEVMEAKGDSMSETSQ